MTTITFRAAGVEDFEFIFELHKATLGPYVNQVWGWDDAFSADRGVRLSVLKVNSDARRLYRRLGFVESKVEGADADVRVHMRAHPPAHSAFRVMGCR
ncbi:hypothetical protein C6A86_028785 [Mycobacterium sp. ITM-2016-00316]|uniref:hypothetical protein n=1 Tax=Mycobacterium sp. ITM-2016-00316 TaxID=2099695 RepID=UPI000CF99419|nr:hypothetical protein [Mycobacterium sp. ITM-2016-00316]WNG82083.1 hypothetical protein C6A86_028785 [Mycobacterium sp. ITM-2016-00316]